MGPQHTPVTVAELLLMPAPVQHRQPSPADIAPRQPAHRAESAWYPVAHPLLAGVTTYFREEWRADRHAQALSAHCQRKVPVGKPVEVLP